MPEKQTLKNTNAGSSPEAPSDDVIQKLSILEKFCYGFGDLAHGLAVASVAIWILNYLTDVALLGAAFASAAIMFGRVWDAVTDPVMGWITDHTNTKYGKRRPYLLFGAIPYACLFVALWTIPEFGGNQWALFFYFCFVIVLFNTSLTIVFVPYATLTAAITNSYNERTSLTGYRMAFSQSAFLIGAAGTPFLVQYFISTPSNPENVEMYGSWAGTAQAFFESRGINSLFGSWAGTERQGYFLTAIIFGFIILLANWVAFFGTRERYSAQEQKQQQNPTKTSRRNNPFLYIFRLLKEIKTNQTFRVSTAIMLLTACASTMVAVNLPYFFQQVIDMESLQPTIFLIIFATAVASMPAWVYLSKRYGKAETYSWAMVSYVVVICFLSFLQKGDETLAIGISFFAGFFNAAALIIPWSIVPDVVEADQLKSGKRREGLFYGGTTFCYKAATGIAVFISGMCLELTGYVPNQPQNPEVLTIIRFLIGNMPAFFLLAGAYYASKYPLNKAKHNEIVRELAQRAEKERKE